MRLNPNETNAAQSMRFVAGCWLLNVHATLSPFPPAADTPLHSTPLPPAPSCHATWPLCLGHANLSRDQQVRVCPQRQRRRGGNPPRDCGRGDAARGDSGRGHVGERNLDLDQDLDARNQHARGKRLDALQAASRSLPERRECSSMADGLSCITTLLQPHRPAFT